MKKKTLIVLLIIPFIIGLLSFISVILLNITVASDISDIIWNYKDNEGFKIRENPYELKATPVINENLILATGNDLIWYSRDNEDKVVDIKQDEETKKYYLYALKEGSCEIVCSNEKGSKSKSFKATIYDNGAIIINYKEYKLSGEQIENVRSYGEYNLSYNELKLDNYNKEKASIKLDIEVVGDNINSNKVVVDNISSKDISFDNTTNELIINKNEDIIGGISTITFRGDDITSNYITSDFKINIIKDGVNVYNYNDLMMATNFSSSGEKVVLQTSLGSFRDIYNGVESSLGEEFDHQKVTKFKPDFTSYKNKDNNISLFGNYNKELDKFNFNNELIKLKTTYNDKFLLDNNSNNEVKVGINLKKDLYGNGFLINGNALCFPNNGSIDTNVKKLYPNSELDYFLGPLAFVTIGDPNNNEAVIVKAFGEDNALLSINGDNITINDLRIKSIDDNSNKRNYAYIGSTIDIRGKNVTIKNSIISNGKNLIRAFDSDNLYIDNSILSNSAEFNLLVGSNKISNYDSKKEIITNFNNKEYKSSFNDFYDKDTNNLNEGSSANLILEKYLGASEALGSGSVDLSCSKEELYKALEVIQEGLDNTSDIINQDGSINYANNININNTYFSDSGIFSIAFETMFNGPYLYRGLSSTISNVLASLLSSPLPNKIGGTSFPSKITLTGNTEFYDYKRKEDIDISCLIEERLSSLVGSIVSSASNLTIDDFFPMKPILIDKCKSLNYMINGEILDSSGNTIKKGEFINTKVAYYGGGNNLSTLINESKSKDSFSEDIEVNLLKDSEPYLNSNTIIQLLSKCVLFAAGFNSFKFVTNNEFNKDKIKLDEVPSKEYLKRNLYN